jgi:hypothetical protein
MFVLAQGWKREQLRGPAQCMCEISDHVLAKRRSGLIAGVGKTDERRKESPLCTFVDDRLTSQHVQRSLVSASFANTRPSVVVT